MKTRLAARKTQLDLRFDSALPNDDQHAWHAGGQLPYLGTTLSLVLDTTCRSPELRDAELHLPLPPAATPQQIRDAAESWLRGAALRLFATVLAELARHAQKSALAGRQTALQDAGPATPPQPGIKLSFGKRSDWVRAEADNLRCHWRLIEQSPAIIEQVLGTAWRQWQRCGSRLPI